MGPKLRKQVNKLKVIMREGKKRSWRRRRKLQHKTEHLEYPAFTRIKAYISSKRLDSKINTKLR